MFLIEISSSEKAAIVDILLSHGVNPNDDSHPDGYLPIHRACMGKYIEHTETVQMFLDFEIDPHITTKTGETCVELAEKANNKGYGLKKSVTRLF